MVKDIQELTENERYDLKRKQLKEERLDLTDEKIRAEKLAYSIELFKNLEAITNNKKVVVEKDVRDSILLANCDLIAENKRLKEQLDREIHINRKMKSALKSISEQFDKIDFGDFEKNFICKTSRLTLKEIDNKE